MIADENHTARKSVLPWVRSRGFSRLELVGGAMYVLGFFWLVLLCILGAGVLLGVW